MELAKSSLTANPGSATLLAAMGNVQYRRGEIPECEASFLNATKIDPNLVEAYLGLARVYRTALLYRRAYGQLKRAHEIAPQNAEVQRAWIGCCRGVIAFRRWRPISPARTPTIPRKQPRLTPGSII